MFKSPVAMLLAGLVLGAIVGLSVGGFWPHTPVYAVATHGQDNFAIATGPVSNDVEAVYILDYLTGELKGAVMNLQTGKFTSFFKYNVGADLATENSKNPRYLMVTGMTNLRRGALGQLSNSVVYVAEFNSGQIAAYGVPWTTGRENVITPYQGPFIPLDGMKFRATPIRD